MLALHLNNLLFLLFIAIAFFFQILTRVSKAGRRSDRTQPRSTPPSQRTRPLTEESADTDEERIRKFLEALGQPAGSRPPEPIRPRSTYQEPVLLPNVPPFASPLPPLKTRPPEPDPDWRSRREIRLPEQSPTREARTFRPRVAEAPSAEVHNAPLQTPPPIMPAAETYELATRPPVQAAEKKPAIVGMLRSSSGLRDAIILREIFGPPRSLQPLDLVGSV
jgi:hypothetical protein